MQTPRSGWKIDLNECCGQLIAIKDWFYGVGGWQLSFEAELQPSLQTLFVFVVCLFKSTQYSKYYKCIPICKSKKQ